MISITSAVLRFVVQRLMLSSIVTIIARFPLVALADFYWAGTDIDMNDFIGFEFYSNPSHLGKCCNRPESLKWGLPGFES